MDDAEDEVGDNLRRCRLSEPLIFAEADSNESRQRFLLLTLPPFLVCDDGEEIGYGYGWRIDNGAAAVEHDCGCSDCDFD